MARLTTEHETAGKRCRRIANTPSGRFIKPSARPMPRRRNFSPTGSSRSGNSGRRRRNSKTRRNSDAWKLTLQSLSLSRPRTNAWPCPSRPVFPFPCSSNIRARLIIFETAKYGGDEAIAAINNIIFRLLSVHPPGKLSFTIFDPVGWARISPASCTWRITRKATSTPHLDANRPARGGAGGIE